MRLIGLAFVLAMLVSAPAWGQIESAQRSLPARGDYSWFRLLVSPDRHYAVDEVAAISARGEFEVATSRNVNRGFTDAEVWAHFSVRFAPADDKSLYLVVPKPLLDEVELTSIHADGRSVRRLAGDAHPHGSGATRYRAFAFELTPDEGRTVDYYLRVRSSTSAISLPLQLMRDTDFVRLVQTEDFMLGGYFGVMAVLSIAAFILFAAFRQRVVFHYFLYISAFSAALLSQSGYGMQLLWPTSSSANQLLPTTFVALATIAGAALIRNFLHLVAHWPTADRAFVVFAGTAACGAVLHLASTSPTGTIVVIASALASSAIACIAFGRWVLAGDRIARYFLFGWLACVVGIAAAALDMYGLLPTSVVSSYGLYLGSFAEFVALTVALCDRLRIIGHEKESQIASKNAELAALNANLESSVRHRTRELEKRNRELSELAIRDSLTGLYNHSTSIELLDQILHQSQRYEFALTLLMVDIDNFKRVNDTHGHQVGDAVLEVVSQTLLASVRDSDVVGRYGGEEFLIAMPHADVVAAREFGERLLAQIREIAIPRVAREFLSVSIGISVYNPQGKRLTAADLIQRADQALYRSKRNGRDRLTVDSLSVVDNQDDQALMGSKPALPT